MIERTRRDGPVPPRRPRAALGLVVLGAVVLVGGLIALQYGMSLVGKETSTLCPAAAAATARLEPLVHGEVAAFGIGMPAHMAPDLRFGGPDGKPLSLSGFAGKTILLNLWATWCVPCRKEMPSLDALEAKVGGPDFEVVAVNVDTARLERPKQFLNETKIANLGFYADPSGDVLQVLKERGELLGLPTTLLIDRNGCELGRIAGPADWASPDAQRLIEAAKG